MGYGPETALSALGEVSAGLQAREPCAEIGLTPG